ncbi:helix-turn-helix domain-containing protein [Niabella drilacis]|uniref:Zn-dependent peptidase ImmA, M78 family n=1 Tax=Niabella drilacis (strain DSM 25811 / CCM 8410 / CCUG 62505 / LMG 26954 / E90) TaxID=1285928 RepID=A0A1G7A986_NIADE|nr:XRE family transcriptional regulator [Niabella drilacis]SDE11508.1 Zn-dependent peptidase ImmA, M78 family [Niabella drilacis]
MHIIDHRQIIFAREFRGLSQTDLSNRIDGLSQSNLSKFEKGLSVLSEEVLNKIINELDFPVSFFQKKIYNPIENVHFRKRSGMPKKYELALTRELKLYGYIIDSLSESIEWPEFKLRGFDLEEYSISSVAKKIRSVFLLKDDEPVTNIYNLLERNGIIIIEHDASEKFDGVSFVSDKGYKLIILNKNFSNDRKRFTLSHELGHLLLHIIDNPILPLYREDKKESEANEFASSFLMPRDVIIDSLYNLTLRNLAELKRYWQTSMASILRRAKDLNCISPERYQYLNIELSRHGYKTQEPIEVTIDGPKLYKKAVQLFRESFNYDEKDFAADFSLPRDITEKFLFQKAKVSQQNKLRVIL